MEIAFDAITTATNVAATSLTFSHTTSGSNRILFVGVLGTGGVTGVTYNGVSMTLIDSNALLASNTLYLYYLIAPATGANNIIVSQSASSFLDAVAISYTGVAQSSQPNASAKANSSGTVSTLTTSTTTTLDNCWSVEMFRDVSLNQVPTAGANTIVRNNNQYVPILDSNSPKTPSGSTSLVANIATATTDLGTVMASFAPFVAPTTNSNFFPFF